MGIKMLLTGGHGSGVGSMHPDPRAQCFVNLKLLKSLGITKYNIVKNKQEKAPINHIRMKKT